MADLHRGQREGGGTVEELIHRRNLVGHRAVVHRGHRIGIGIAGGKADHLGLGLTVFVGSAGDLVAQQQAAVRIGGQGQVDLIGRLFIHHSGGAVVQDVLSCKALGFLVSETVVARPVVAVVERTGFGFKLCQIGRRGGVGGEAPTGEEVGQVLLGSGRSQPHEVLIGTGPQRQFDAAGCRRLGRVAGVGIHAGIETALEQIVVVVVDLVLVALVVGEVQLPVHAQLGEHIAGRTGGTAGNLAVDGIIAKAHAFAGLGDLREVVVGNFRHGIAALVDVMADLMGNAPAEEAAAGRYRRR